LAGARDVAIEEVENFSCAEAIEAKARRIVINRIRFFILEESEPSIIIQDLTETERCEVGDDDRDQTLQPT